MKDRRMKTSRLLDKTIQRLRKEAVAWDRAVVQESERRVTAELERAEVFRVRRPAR